MTDASNAGLDSISRAFSAALDRRRNQIVTVAGNHGRASGFAWSADLIVTADEALGESDSFTILLAGGAQREARLAGRDPATDIAVLRVQQADLAPVSAEAPPPPPAPGALVLAAGACQGEPLAALGIVASLGPEWESMRGGRIDARVELDLRLRREAEGGLVLDAQGRALGMAVFGPRRRVLLIPAATLHRVVPALERHGRIPRGRLGLALKPVRADGDGCEAAMIISVEPGSAAEAAGLRQGDVIVTWNGQPFPGIAAMLRALGPDSVGQAVTLGLRRAGEPRSISLTVGG